MSTTRTLGVHYLCSLEHTTFADRELLGCRYRVLYSIRKGKLGYRCIYRLADNAEIGFVVVGVEVRRLGGDLALVDALGGRRDVAQQDPAGELLVLPRQRVPTPQVFLRIGLFNNKTQQSYSFQV